jgi:hypothetical protein
MKPINFEINPRLSLNHNRSQFFYHLRCRFGQAREGKKGHALRVRNLRRVLSGKVSRR